MIREGIRTNLTSLDVTLVGDATVQLVTDSKPRHKLCHIRVVFLEELQKADLKRVYRRN